MAHATKAKAPKAKAAKSTKKAAPAAPKAKAPKASAATSSSQPAAVTTAVFGPTKLAGPVLEAIVGRLRAGTTALIRESRALGYKGNNELRAALRELLTRAGYDALMHDKRPEARQQARREGKVVAAVPLPDDSAVPTVTSMRAADGWSWRRVPEHEARPRKIEIDGEDRTIMDSGALRLVMKSPEGVEYAEAQAREIADLLYLLPKLEGGPIRFIMWEKSNTKRALEHALEHGDAQLARGEAALARKRQATRALPSVTSEEAAAPTKRARTSRRSTK